MLVIKYFVYLCFFSLILLKNVLAEFQKKSPIKANYANPNSATQNKQIEASPNLISALTLAPYLLDRLVLTEISLADGRRPLSTKELSQSLYTYPFKLARTGIDATVSNLLSVTKAPFEAAAQFASGFSDLTRHIQLSDLDSDRIVTFESSLPLTIPELLQDLKFALKSADALFESLTTFQASSLLPLSIFTRPATVSSVVNDDKFNLGLAGLTGLKRMAQQLEETFQDTVSRSFPFIGNLPLTASSILPEPVLSGLCDQADLLYGELDSLLITLSQGMSSALDTVFVDLQNHFFQLLNNPDSAVSWLQVSKSLETVHDVLKRMLTLWKFDPATSLLVKDLMERTDNTLWKLESLPALPQLRVTSAGTAMDALVDGSGLADVLQNTMEVLANLTVLNSTILEPILHFGDTPLGQIIKTTPEKIIQIILSEPIIGNITAAVNATITSLLQVPQNITGINFLDLPSLNPFLILESFGEFTKQALDLAFLMDVAKNVTDRTAGSLSTVINTIFGSAEQVVDAFISRLSISNVRDTAISLGQQIIQLLLSFSGNQTEPPATDPPAPPDQTGSRLSYNRFNSPRMMSKRMLTTKQEKKEPFDITSQIQLDSQLFESQKSYFMKQLPVLKAEIDLYEKLRYSECELIIKDIQKLVESTYNQADVKQLKSQVEAVCDDMKFISLSYDFQKLLKSYQQLLLPMHPTKAKQIHEESQQTIQKFLASLKGEKEIAQKRAEFLKTLQLPSPPSKAGLFR